MAGFKVYFYKKGCLKISAVYNFYSVSCGMLKIIARFPYSEKVVKLSVACACCVFVGSVCRPLCLADSVWRIFLPTRMKGRMGGGRRTHCPNLFNPTLQRISIYVFTEKELRDLYSPTIGSPIFLRLNIGRQIVGIYV